MKTLILPLKKMWYDMIASGEKTEEYREINRYWCLRLCALCDAEYSPAYEKFFLTQFDVIEFTLGYPKKDDASRRMTFKCEGISIGKGKLEWGAEPDKDYFIIKIGERIK